MSFDPPETTANAKQREPSGKSQATQNNPISPPVFVKGKVEIHLPPDVRDEKSISAKKKDTREKIKQWVEGITLIFVIIVAIFSGVQTRQTIKSADAAVTQADLTEKQFKLSQRPWISSSPAIDSDFVFDRTGSVQLTLKFSLHNSGLTPATNVFVYAKFFRLDTSLDQAKEQKRITCQAASGLVGDSEQVVIPGGNATQQTRIGIRGSDMSGYVTDSPYLPIQIVSCVAYKSPDGTPYASPQIYSLDGINIPNLPIGFSAGMQVGKDVPASQLRVIPKNSDAQLY